ncbi:N-acyl amino acid synthase FeeM domain-containing protein [Zeimonas arvi]|uniref:N-acyl amino acid synthase FeeM catalytic core domain-containing protein n=1 Tax=Zeimonas arvi TaxID=2498847 RepID=A0A5C8P4J1_9BURK|nr:hypothetical protein [Zeimonas arvi]TXL68399.1 hypothetical protein FHP08_01555 [Zeimonas arvi]
MYQAAPLSAFLSATCQEKHPPPALDPQFNCPRHAANDADGQSLAARSLLTASLLRDVSPSRLSIRVADTVGQRREASVLVSKMYGWRGYRTEGAETTARPEVRSARNDASPTGVTLIAFLGQRLVGTLTVGVDSPAGLACSELYPDEVARLRAEGARICEFTRLAVDGAEHSTQLLAMMFHVAFIYARQLRGGTDLLVEVNPRHAAFYRRMLDFSQLGPERVCSRVNAPAVLLGLKLEHAEQQIARFGGHDEIARGVRSLYPLGFRPEEIARIASRLGAAA